MLQGFDMSHYQSDKVFTDYLNRKPDFMILKASEGKTWKDFTFKNRLHELNTFNKETNSNILLGAYHYARPENGNTPREELDNFMECIDSDILLRVFLDIERSALKYPSWCEGWLMLAKKELPTVGYYCSASAVNNQLKNLRGKFPLWVAHYNNEDADGCAHVEGEIITQYTSTPVDVNVAINMTYYQWYGIKEPYDDPKEESMYLTEREREIIRTLRSLYN